MSKRSINRQIHSLHSAELCFFYDAPGLRKCDARATQSLPSALPRALTSHFVAKLSTTREKSGSYTLSLFCVVPRSSLIFVLVSVMCAFMTHVHRLPLPWFINRDLFQLGLTALTCRYNTRVDAHYFFPRYVTSLKTPKNSLVTPVARPPRCLLNHKHSGCTLLLCVWFAHSVAQSSKGSA